MQRIKYTGLIAAFLVSVVLSSGTVQAEGTQRSLNDDLMYRISFGRADDVRLLLEKGAEPNIFAGMGETPIILAMTRKEGDADDIIKALLAKGGDPNFPDKNGNYPLEIAINQNKPSIITLLIEAGGDLRMRSKSGMTMVDLANKGNNPDVIKVVMDKIQKDADQEAKLHDPARLLTMVQGFSDNICKMTYWNNYLTSAQNPKDDDASREKVDKYKNMAEKMGREIANYFPNVQLNTYITFTSSSLNNVFVSMPTMQSRIEGGIGSEQDAQKRCTPIADSARDSIQKMFDAQRAAQEKAAHDAQLVR